MPSTKLINPFLRGLKKTTTRYQARHRFSSRSAGTDFIHAHYFDHRGRDMAGNGRPIFFRQESLGFMKAVLLKLKPAPILGDQHRKFSTLTTANHSACIIYITIGILRCRFAWHENRDPCYRAHIAFLPVMK
jgi:hypothetical protein